MIENFSLMVGSKSHKLNMGFYRKKMGLGAEKLARHKFSDSLVVSFVGFTPDCIYLNTDKKHVTKAGKPASGHVYINNTDPKRVNIKEANLKSVPFWIILLLALEGDTISSYYVTELVGKDEDRQGVSAIIGISKSESEALLTAKVMADQCGVEVYGLDGHKVDMSTPVPYPYL
tara:strand:+ start:2040 stop:2561 length:522 start_codon:yes stop_codon:yes gene_type:complete